MSISVRKMNVEEEPYCNMKTYVHMGMFATAVTIQNILLENEVLQSAFEKFPVSLIHEICWNYQFNPGSIVLPRGMQASHILISQSCMVITEALST